MFWWGFLIGIFVGGVIGVGGMAWFVGIKSGAAVRTDIAPVERPVEHG